ncbi:hypothetical protein ONZ45_g11722 [Pleurotus djamor]|nr:hypothetical protein ONZ45_g11722 [Pleurotus djamor]
MPLSIQEQTKYLAKYPNRRVTFASDGFTRQIQLATTNRLVSVEDIHKIFHAFDGKNEPTHAQAREFLDSQPPARRVCDACRKVSRACILDDRGARCNYCSTGKFGCSLRDRYRMDVVRRQYSFTMSEVVEVYAPFAIQKLDLANPAWLDSVADASKLSSMTATAPSVLPPPPTPANSRRCTTRSATSTPSAGARTLRLAGAPWSKKDASVRFQDLEDDGSSTPPPPLSSVNVRSPSSKKASASTSRTASVGEKRNRSPESPSASSPSDPPVPSEQSSLPPSSSSKRKMPESVEGRIASLENELQMLREEVDTQRERADVAESEIGGVRKERSNILLHFNQEKESSTKLLEKPRSLQASVDQERLDNAQQREDATMVQVLAWVMHTSAGLGVFQELLSSAVVPESSLEPVSIPRHSFDLSLALVKRQRTGLQQLLMSHLPAFEQVLRKLPFDDPTTEDRLQYIEDGARAARLEMVNARVTAEEKRMREEQEAALAKKQATRLRLEEQMAALQSQISALDDSSPPNPSPSVH